MDIKILEKWAKMGIALLSYSVQGTVWWRITHRGAVEKTMCSFCAACDYAEELYDKLSRPKVQYVPAQPDVAVDPVGTDRLPCVVIDGVVVGKFPQNIPTGRLREVIDMARNMIDEEVGKGVDNA